MNLMQLNNLVNRTELGIPGAWIEFAQVSEKAYAFRINVKGPDNSDPKAPHRDWPGRYWLVTGVDNENQVKNTLLKAVLTYVEHEARERFKIDGKPIYESAH